MARAPAIRLTILAAGVLILAGFGLIGTPDGESLRFNLVWFSAFEQAFWQGTPYPRHLPELWDGVGGFDFFFYGPMPYWIGAAIARPLCLPCSDQAVFALAGGIILLLSGAAFYWAARKLVPREAAFAGAVLYMVLPYHLWVGWFIRQAAGEFTAYVFVPLVLGGFLNIAKGGRGHLLALGWAGLMLSHLPSALLAGHGLALVGLICAGQMIWRGERPAALRLVASLLLYGVLGALVAALYWLPAVVLMDEVSSELLFLPYFEAERWLFLDGLAAPNPGFEQVTILLLAGGAVPVVMALLSGAGRDPAFLLLAALPVVLAALAMSALSAPIWQAWVIRLVQFPWRSLLFVDVAAALALAYLVARRPWSEWGRPLRWALIGVTLGTTALVLPDAARAILRSSEARAEMPEFGGAVEYLPPTLIAATGIGATGNHREIERSVLAHVRAVDARPEVTAGTLENRRFHAILAPAASNALLAVPYWPHWTAVDGDGAPVALTLDPETGMTRASAAGPTASITMTLPLHWSEMAGLSASGLAAIMLFILAIRWRVSAIRNR